MEIFKYANKWLTPQMGVILMSRVRCAGGEKKPAFKVHPTAPSCTIKS